MMQDQTPSLLLVDDDETFRTVLTRVLQRRGFSVQQAASEAEALASAGTESPEYAVVDLKLGNDSGLAVVKALHELDATTRIVVLTGYASIATAIEAIKLGATHYLPKPASADEIIAAFQKTEGSVDAAELSPMSVSRVEWEHINKVLAENDGNISATARALKMHRRTLQRKLAKRPAGE